MAQGRPGGKGEGLLADLTDKGFRRVDDHVELIPALGTAGKATVNQEDRRHLAGFQGAEGLAATQNGGRPVAAICVV